jgi:uncharacterized surface protein with fasciclin (FAS1) repeats
MNRILNALLSAALSCSLLIAGSQMPQMQPCQPGMMPQQIPNIQMPQMPQGMQAPQMQMQPNMMQPQTPQGTQAPQIQMQGQPQIQPNMMPPQMPQGMQTPQMQPNMMPPQMPQGMQTPQGIQTQGQPSAAPATQGIGDIIEEGKKNPDLSSFLSAVQIAGKTEDAKMTTPPAPFIVFAPNNAAFAAANIPQTKDALKPFIKYLVTVGIKNITDQTKDKLPAQLESIAGAKITINADKTIGAEKANIVQSIPCSNGTIHIIDKMLTPVK